MTAEPALEPAPSTPARSFLGPLEVDLHRVGAGRRLLQQDLLGPGHHGEPGLVAEEVLGRHDDRQVLDRPGPDQRAPRLPQQLLVVARGDEDQLRPLQRKRPRHLGHVDLAAHGEPDDAVLGLHDRKLVARDVVEVPGTSAGVDPRPLRVRAAVGERPPPVGARQANQVVDDARIVTDLLECPIDDVDLVATGRLEQRGLRVEPQRRRERPGIGLGEDDEVRPFRRCLRDVSDGVGDVQPVRRSTMGKRLDDLELHRSHGSALPIGSRALRMPGADSLVRMIRRVVLWRWRDGVTVEQRLAATEGLAYVSFGSPSVAAFDFGEDLGLDGDRNYGLVMIRDHADRAAWDVYDGDPHHFRVGAFIDTLTHDELHRSRRLRLRRSRHRSAAQYGTSRSGHGAAGGVRQARRPPQRSELRHGVGRGYPGLGALGSPTTFAGRAPEAAPTSSSRRTLRLGERDAAGVPCARRRGPPARRRLVLATRPGPANQRDRASRQVWLSAGADDVQRPRITCVTRAVHFSKLRQAAATVSIASA